MALFTFVVLAAPIVHPEDPMVVIYTCLAGMWLCDGWAWIKSKIARS